MQQNVRGRKPGADFNGNATAPVEAGSYEVMVEIAEINYEGSASATFVLTDSPLGTTRGYSLKVYPNPAANSIRVQSAHQSEVLIYDLEGKLQMRGSTNESLDVSGLKSGAYLIRIDQQQTKFIKE